MEELIGLRNWFYNNGITKIILLVNSESLHEASVN